MAAPRFCPRCGLANPVEYQFCTNCGNALGAAVVPPVPSYGAPLAPGYPVFYPGPPSGYYAMAWEAERQKQIGRTKTGVLLLVIGVLIGWIPVIELVGSVLVLIGAVLVLLGRKVFGARHSLYVVIAFVLTLAGVAAAFVLGFVIGFTAVAGPTIEEAIAAFQALLIGLPTIAATAGIASVLITHELEPRIGKILLWAGYAGTTAVAIYISYVLSPVLAAALAAGNIDVLAFSTLADVYSLLYAVPSAIFGAAYYLAWSRINRREIPAPPSASGPAVTATPPPPRP